MSLTITNERLIGDATKHHAWREDAEAGVWRVSWLPSEPLDRNQAITAVTLAELVSTACDAGGLTSDHKDWPLIHTLADQLGMSAPAVVGLLGA